MDVDTLLNRLKANKKLLKELSWRIIDAWNARMDRKDFFRMFLDGNPKNSSEENVILCDINGLLAHYHGSVIDWERGLTEEEIELIATTNWIELVRAHTLLRRDGITPMELRLRT